MSSERRKSCRLLNMPARRVSVPTRAVLSCSVLTLSLFCASETFANDFGGDVGVGRMASQAGLKREDWLFLPSVVSGVKYDSNLFELSEGNSPRDEVIFYSAPKITAIKKFRKGSLTFGADSLMTRYLFDERYSYNDVSGSIGGEYKISPKTVFTFATNLSKSHELPRVTNLDAATDAAEPISSTEFDGNLQLSFSHKRFSHSLKLGYSTQDFDDVRRNGGGTADQDFRNKDTWSASKDFTFIVSRHIKASTSASVETTKNEFLPARDVTEYGVNTELLITLSSKLSAVFNFGLSRDDFHNAPDSDLQPSFEAAFSWKPTRHLTFNLNTSQDQTSTNFEEGGGSIKKKTIGGEILYDVTKNLSVKASATFKESDLITRNRTVEEQDYQLSAQYAINRNLGLVIMYSHDNRETSDAVGSFERDTVQGSLVAKF